MGRLSLLGNKDYDGQPADPARSKYDVTKGEYAAQVKSPKSRERPINGWRMRGGFHRAFSLSCLN
jgi:hypothetical protein